MTYSIYEDKGRASESQILLKDVAGASKRYEAVHGGTQTSLDELEAEAYIKLDQALKERWKIEISGDGSEKLDFTYIQDLVDGITKVIENPKSKNQIFNLTFGSSRSVNDMLEILKKYFPKVIVQYKPKDKLTPKRGTLLTDKAKSLLGYDPKWTLDKGYPKYIEWYKKLYESN